MSRIVDKFRAQFSRSFNPRAIRLPSSQPYKLATTLKIFTFFVGIEAEAVMLGQAISMLLPEVVGYKLVGELNQYVTSTDLVLTITKNLRQLGVVGKFVEFYGPGVEALSIADRATISNMCPEYGATVGYFPVDVNSLGYLRQTSRNESTINIIEQYLRATKQLRDYNSAEQDPTFTINVTLDLSTVVSSVSGPKRPNDRVSVSDMKLDFSNCLNNKVINNP